MLNNGIKNGLAVIVGSEHLFDDPVVLKNYSKDFSLAPPKYPNFVVRPKVVEEIQDIVRLANRFLIPIIPLSSGVHFYGETLPSQGGIILDLTRMNKILKIDVRNRGVRIEPGVTWGKLYEELKKRNLMALNPLLPHKLKSALSSSLEREPMLIPKTEYGEPILTMEVVLPYGELFRTGSASVGHPDEIRTDLVGSPGPGIDWFRLFQGTQGTLCIVSWVNMKAPPHPKMQKLFFITSQNIQILINFLYAIQKIMLGSECLLLNNFNLALILADDWPDQFFFLKDTLPKWSVILCLSGSERLPEEKIAYEENDLEDICEHLKVEPKTNLPGIKDAGKILLDKLSKPWNEEPYWKFRYRGGCHQIFFYTTMDKVPEFIQLVKQFTFHFQVSPEDIGIYLQPIERGRACHLEFDFPYNPYDTNEIEKALSFHKELSTSLLRNGALFSRPYGIWGDLTYAQNATLTQTLRKLKSILDPFNLLNPGKLCF